MYTYPSANGLDSVNAVASVLGSLWSRDYGGKDTVRSLAAAVASTARQAANDLVELGLCCGRYDVPLFHTDQWALLTLTESQVNAGTASLLAFDGEAAFEPNEFFFGVPRTLPTYNWPAPADLAAAPLLFNRITEPSCVLVEGVDYRLVAGQLVFRADPFADARIPKVDVLTDGVVTDRQALLWVFRGQTDRRYMYYQFGSVLGLDLVSSANYKDLVNALIDALLSGTTAVDIDRALSAIAGAPLVRNARETVQLIRAEPGRLLILTDREVYVFAAAATPLVVVGDVVTRGQSLTNALQLYRFNRGQCPSAAEVPALALGRDFLDPAIGGDLVFENKDVPLQVSTDADGYTQLAWAIGGWPTDVATFFARLQAKGRDADYTLAHLLDVRGRDCDDEPTAASLPATINPFKFLCENVLRNHFALAVIRPACCQDGLGLDTAKILARVIPPPVALLILAILQRTEQPIIMEGPGTETAPGYTERGTSFLGLTGAEAMDPAVLFKETVRVRLVGGRCG